MGKTEGKILIIDDNEDILLAAGMLLKQHFTRVRTEKDPRALLDLLRRESYDVILLDMNFTQDVTSGSEGFYWLKQILTLDPAMVVILITAYGDMEMAVRAIREGAMDFVLKPWQNEKLLATISAAMSLRQSLQEVDRLRSRQQQLSATIDQPFHDMIGVSPCMREVFESIRKVAPTEANLLIVGENGTGKELVARALHRGSSRRDEVFITVDMGAIPENLFESELFGYVKGAFTDARENRPGRFEVASGGTLFLDEISNIPMYLQSKLLRVLETRQVTRLGSNRPLDIDIRLICATNMPIADLVARQEFRQDLLYRINTVEINLPPLRSRQEDIPLLVDHFTALYARKYKKAIAGISAAALKKLQKYHWPGNIRELQHAMERAVILTNATILEPGDFVCPEPGQAADEGLLADNNLEHVEKMVIQRTLAKHGGNVTHTAEELGLSRMALYRRMARYGL
ncbi:MAG: sigma-54-dependent Fis family transcriptional regulator [Desulfurivibrio sp.]|nr:MAG: sigma-54-dependent Fis family transcriptional regulator [Desulfurivibrio sp.]